MNKEIQQASVDAPTKARKTTKVEIHLHGREYVVACDEGEEAKLASIVAMVEKKIKEIATQGVNNSETRIFMLTCLLLADELIEARNHADETRKADETLMVAAVNHLRSRVRDIEEKIEQA